MVNVNKKYLEKNLRDLIWDDFSKEIKKAKTKRDLKELIGRFFTPAEQIMLEKRLAITHLIKRGISYREIGRRIDVSFGTISFIKGGFIKKKPQKKTKKEIAGNSRPGFKQPRYPTYKGKGRWRFLNSL